MKTLALLALVLSSNLHAETPGNPVERYFGKIPVEEAHRTWGQSSSAPLPKSGIDLLVWNVKKGDRPSFHSEFLRLGEKKDLFLIQELFTAPFFTSTINEFSGLQWELGLSFFYRLYNNDSTGNMIGSLSSPTWVKVEHTLNYEPLTETPKTTVYARYALEGTDAEVLVISIHGINFNGFDAYKRQLDQVEAVIRRHQGPVILGGDFNTRTKKRHQELRDFARALRLKEVSFINGDRRMVAIGTKHILDHVFVRGFSVHHAEVHVSPGSDHRPMTLSLDVSASPSR